MQSNNDLEMLIVDKRREIEKEKIALGLSQPATVSQLQGDEDKENVRSKRHKSVRVEETQVLGDHDANTERQGAQLGEIPPDLERYIRRYLGLPVMLKAGEYSPNNPLVRGERAPGDALLGLGEYERRRNTLRKIRQQQYREYLDQQAKKKQEAKEQAERERREREEKERQREEDRERLRQQLEKDKAQDEQRRASVCYVPTVVNHVNSHKNKVDTGVQVGTSMPLSVAVQTDDAELYALSQPQGKCKLTQAERELSPRTVAGCVADRWGTGGEPERDFRRRSYGDFAERSFLRKSNRDHLVSDLRHTYMPSIFDAEAIHMRNLQAEKEASERRQFYQQELKNQIEEQQRIREERKTREKMLELAEMRRLEEQLRALRVAQHREQDRHRDITATLKENTNDYNKKRTALQKEIDCEQQNFFRATTQCSRRTGTTHSDTTTKLPSFNPHQEIRPPFSTNIPDNSIFSPSYDVDSYLRKNLNPKKESLLTPIETEPSEKNVIVEKALVHDRPKDKPKLDKITYEPSFMKNREEIDDTPIPVLRHSPILSSGKENEVVSEGMKLVEDKWKVPIVQKNILKSLPNEEGKNVSILTQLGSIRRQLQLEQLRLDNMVPRGD